MAVTQVTYLVPPAGASEASWPGEEEYPLHVAQGILNAAPGAYAITLLCCGPAAEEAILAPGLTRRVLPVPRRSIHPLDSLSWDMLPALAEADIVHLFHPFNRAGEVGLLLARLRRLPLCVTVYGEASSKLFPELDLLELASHVFCPTAYGASLLATRARVEVVRGGVDGTFFTPAESRTPRHHFLHVGPLLPATGIAELIAALPPELPLTVCGKAGSEDFLQTLRTLAQGKRVTFVPSMDRGVLRELYRRAWATVFLAPPEEAGPVPPAGQSVGLALLNSLACGTPVLCARNSGLAELVRHGDTGFLCQDQKELIRCVTELAASSQHVEQLGQRARRVVERDFELRVVGARVCEVYDTLGRNALRAAG